MLLILILITNYLKAPNMAKFNPLLRFSAKDKLKVARFALAHFTNFEFNSYENCTIKLSQPLTSHIIIQSNAFSIKNKWEIIFDTNSITFKYILNNDGNTGQDTF